MGILPAILLVKKTSKKESLDNHITWITVVGKQGFLMHLFKDNIKWLTYYLLIPLVLIFAYLRLIAATLMSLQQSGFNLSSKTLSALSSCRTKIWLIPKGDAPFQLPNFLNDKPLFNEQFKATFLKKYELKDKTKYYDLWYCK